MWPHPAPGSECPMMLVAECSSLTQTWWQQWARSSLSAKIAWKGRRSMSVSWGPEGML